MQLLDAVAADDGRRLIAALRGAVELRVRHCRRASQVRQQQAARERRFSRLSATEMIAFLVPAGLS
jgi:hypothetical protein